MRCNNDKLNYAATFSKTNLDNIFYNFVIEHKWRAAILENKEFDVMFVLITRHRAQVVLSFAIIF